MKHMKHFKLLVLAALCGAMLTSCRYSSTVSRTIPIAINTVNSVRLNELNLERKDYTILKSITAEAVVLYKEDGDRTIIEEEGGEFSMVYEYDDEVGLVLRQHTGIARYGFLSNDYGEIIAPRDVATNPGYVARNLAIYRAINICKVQGGDGLIEPVISMSVEERKDHKIAFKTVVTAKLLKLKTDK